MGILGSATGDLQPVTRTDGRRAGGSTGFGPIALLAAASLAALTSAGTASAQTPFSSLTAPQGPPALARSPSRGKEGTGNDTNPCSNYGAGFIAVAGTNTCIKAGMAVRSEVSADVHR